MATCNVSFQALLTLPVEGVDLNVAKTFNRQSLVVLFKIVGIYCCKHCCWCRTL